MPASHIQAATAMGHRSDMKTLVAVAIVVVLLLICFVGLRRDGCCKDRMGGTLENPGNPMRYAYGDWLIARAAAGGPAHGLRSEDGAVGHDHGAGGVSRVAFNDNHGYHSEKEGLSVRENMSVGAHWDSEASYGHTADTLSAFSLSGYNEDTPATSWV